MNTPVDVVVVNYNSGDALKTCLTQLLQPPIPALRVWVIDNDSTDRSLAEVEVWKDQFCLIKQSENTGFSRACNLGASQGQAAVVAFVNPDCFVRAEQLQQLANTLMDREKAALIGCRVLNQDGSLQAASRRRLPTFWRVFCHQTGLSRWRWFKGINIKDQGLFSQPQLVTAVNGACMLVKRQVFSALGGFDENYPLHFEDLDLFTRIRKAGHQIVYDSATEVQHLQGHAKQDPAKITSWKRQGLLRYFELHRPAWEQWIMRLILGSK